MKKVFENGMYAIMADPGMVIDHGDGYCHKLYRETDNFTDCTEVDASVVPVTEEEATAADYEAALSEMGVDV